MIYKGGRMCCHSCWFFYQLWEIKCFKRMGPCSTLSIIAEAVYIKSPRKYISSAADIAFSIWRANPRLVSYDKSLFFCARVISSVSHADLLARFTRFSLIGTCLLRTDKKNTFHFEQFIFESVCEHLKFWISVLWSSKNAECSKFVNDLNLIVLWFHFLIFNFDVYLVNYTG